MIKKTDKNGTRKARHIRIRNKVAGTASRPRLNVYRSTTNIYAQIIDDVAGITLVAANSLQADIAEKAKNLTKVETAKLVGIAVAEAAIAKGVSEVVFDRGGYLYAGRVQALADGAREAGLKF